MSDGKSKPAGWRRLHRLLKPDWIFGLLLILIAMQITKQVVTGTEDGTAKFLVALGLTVLASLLSGFGVQFDRRIVEDYFYQLIAQSAVIAVVTTFVVFAIFESFPDIFNALRPSDVIFVLITSWTLGYFFVRWRGFNS